MIYFFNILCAARAGDPHCGKRSLLQQFKHRGTAVAAHAPSSSGADNLIEYSFFDDTESDDSISGRVNVWQFNDAAYSERLVPRLLAARATALAASADVLTSATAVSTNVAAAGVTNWERACIVVCVDLSRPDACVRSLARWLRAVEHIQATIASSGALSEAQQQRLCYNSAILYFFNLFVFFSLSLLC